MNCGPRCLVFLEKENGRELTLRQARKLAGTNRDGTGPAALARAWKALGYKDIRLRQKLTWDALIELARDNHVIIDWFSILSFDKPTLPDGHYSVVLEVTKDKIRLYDPDADAEYSLPRTFFETFWFDFSLHKGKVITFWRGAIVARKQSQATK